MSFDMAFGGFRVNMTASFGFTSASFAQTVVGGFSAAGSVGGAQIMSFASSFKVNIGMDRPFMPVNEFPQPAPVPQPEIGYSGTPAGKGLEKNPAGWPEGSVKTAGGYVVVPEGNTNWSIYEPGQKPGEKPSTRIWGDPHVTEADGGRWDFSKSSDFVLPDGTRIAAKTSSETGQSVTTGLEIANGADHVSVTGVNGKPTTSEVKHDGYEWRAQHLAANPGRDTYKLGGDGDDWFLVRNGQNQGEVTGAYYDSKTNRYEQKTDGKAYNIDPSLRPQIGSDAWGNSLRNEAIDFIASKYGLDPQTARTIGEMFHQEHSTTQYFENLQKLSAYTGPFGGLYGLAFGWQGAFDAMAGMADAMNSLADLHASQLGFRGAFLY
ncbi:MAG: DUF1521 domain-containing protein [Deltaproteobacteria bacterium]|nr:DUF1521 domain-containing protein [Deltaproteobacteria bacterium]